MTVRVMAPGMFTTVQDLGRAGWGAAGVPPSGGFDDFSLRQANLLVGNHAGAAVLEVTGAGPALLFEVDAIIAVRGASFDTRIDDRPIPDDRAVRVPAGSTVRLGRSARGLRGYVAFAGGVDVPVVLGSRSTLVSATLGGIQGRPLRTGDVFALGGVERISGTRVVDEAALPIAAMPWVLRAISGAHEEMFHPSELRAFFSGAFRVSPRSDRIGVRLHGPVLEHPGIGEIDPEGVLTGDVQVPPDGMPIVLGPDRPATGGYPKIASVIAADLPLLAQIRPGETVRFSLVSLEEARKAFRRREAALTAAIVDVR